MANTKNVVDNSATSQGQEKVRKVKVNNNKGKGKIFLSRISGAFMLPIAVMAVAGFFLGVGATIKTEASLLNGDTSLKTFGILLENLGGPVFNNMPILFGAALVVSFTDEAGVGVFAFIVGFAVFNSIQSVFITETFSKDYTDLQTGGLDANNSGQSLISHYDKGAKQYFVRYHQGWKILFEGAGRDPVALDKIVGSNIGITSINSSIFGGILVGGLVATLYNKFHTIKLPTIISFFGGKKFVGLISVVAVIPLSFFMLLIWPYIGYGLNAFGKWSADLPGGIDSLIVGIIRRSLIPIGLHHVFYAPLWWTSAGGNLHDAYMDWAQNGNVLVNASDQTILTNPAATGDVNMWQAVRKLPNNVLWNDANGNSHSLQAFDFAQKQLGLHLGRFMDGAYPVMLFGLPAAGIAMIMAAPKENRKMAAGTIIPAIITSFTTGVTEPIEFTFVFLAPWLFWGFHAVLMGVSYMLANILQVHVGMTFSGGILDLIIYGVLPMQQGTHFWWLLVIGAGYAPIYYFVFYFAITKKDLGTPGRGGNTKLFSKADFRNKGKSSNDSSKLLTDQGKAIIMALGGWDNIKKYSNCATRLRYDIVSKDKVDTNSLKEYPSNAVGVSFIGNGHIQVIIGPAVDSLNTNIKANIGADLNFDSSSSKIETKTKSSSKSLALPVIAKSVGVGTLRSLKSLNDGVFSNGIMGKGVVVSLSAKKSGSVFSPVSGTLSTVFPTGHAYGITTDEGVEILVHIGVDTVNLNGKGFESQVKQGDKIESGAILAKVDLEFVRKNAPTADVVVLAVPSSKGVVKVPSSKGKVTKNSNIIEFK
ncbi:MAG: glucose PTS transporter subunit IIA [Mollicutes bacterium PWAP]|nr:glucose PTS transporter subunit IIA [Mollicutes bacterium PWAP]